MDAQNESPQAAPQFPLDLVADMVDRAVEALSEELVPKMESLLDVPVNGMPLGRGEHDEVKAFVMRTYRRQLRDLMTRRAWSSLLWEEEIPDGDNPQQAYQSICDSIRNDIVQSEMKFFEFGHDGEHPSQLTSLSAWRRVILNPMDCEAPRPSVPRPMFLANHLRRTALSSQLSYDRLSAKQAIQLAERTVIEIASRCWAKDFAAMTVPHDGLDYAREEWARLRRENLEETSRQHRKRLVAVLRTPFDKRVDGTPDQIAERYADYVESERIREMNQMRIQDRTRYESVPQLVLEHCVPDEACARFQLLAKRAMRQARRAFGTHRLGLRGIVHLAKTAHVNLASRYSKARDDLVSAYEGMRGYNQLWLEGTFEDAKQDLDYAFFLTERSRKTLQRRDDPTPVGSEACEDIPIVGCPLR